MIVPVRRTFSHNGYVTWQEGETDATSYYNNWGLKYRLGQSIQKHLVVIVLGSDGSYQRPSYVAITC